MIKRILAVAALTIGLLAAPGIVNAKRVYNESDGAWTIQGYAEDGKRSCVISTYWPDGKRININVFPRADGSQYTTMTIKNPNWSMDVGYTENSDIDFVFDDGSAGTLNADWARKDSETLIARELTAAFS
jgi:hypothetical protein